MNDHNQNKALLHKVSITVYEQFSYEAGIDVLDRLEGKLDLHWDVFEEECKAVYEYIVDTYEKRELD